MAQRGRGAGRAKAYDGRGSRRRGEGRGHKYGDFRASRTPTWQQDPPWWGWLPLPQPIPAAWLVATGQFHELVEQLDAGPRGEALGQEKELRGPDEGEGEGGDELRQTQGPEDPAESAGGAENQGRHEAACTAEGSPKASLTTSTLEATEAVSEATEMNSAPGELKPPGAGGCQATEQRGSSGQEPDTAAKAAAVTETLLGVLAPAVTAAGSATGQSASTATGLPPLLGYMPKRRSWVVAETRSPLDAKGGLLMPQDLLGHWVDSLGNAVHVLSTDAYDVRLLATLSRPPRPDIHLSVKPVMLGGGWQCGHSLLDATWSSPDQLHWVAVNGHVSVWVRPASHTRDTGKEDTGSGGEPLVLEAHAGGAAALVKEPDDAASPVPQGDAKSEAEAAAGPPVSSS